jgi:hypothetical protein
LSFSEILPAGVILSALLFLGLWPRGISDRIDQEIDSRYSQLRSEQTMSLPPCCLLENGDSENNQSLSSPLEKIPASKPSAEK